jgi:hypothetical protein
MSCTQDALPLLGYVQYLGDLPERNMRILPFWAFYETDLPWTDKKLPLADSDSFKENLEFESSTFPHFLPPRSFFKSGNNQAWMEHHQKLEDHFSGFLFTLFLWEPKLLRVEGGLTIFVFLPEQMKQFLGFSTKLKKHKYHSC